MATTLENPAAIQSAFFTLGNPYEFPCWEPVLNEEIALGIAERVWAEDDRALELPWRPHFNIVVGHDSQHYTGYQSLADRHHKSYDLCLGDNDFSLINQRVVNVAFAREIQLTLDLVDAQTPASGIVDRLLSARRNNASRQAARLERAQRIGREFSLLPVIELV